MVVYKRVRVDGTDGQRAPLNTTWNNCSVPTRKAAMDPAR